MTYKMVKKQVMHKKPKATSTHHKYLARAETAIEALYVMVFEDFDLLDALSAAERKKVSSQLDQLLDRVRDMQSSL